MAKIAKRSKPYRAARYGILNSFGDVWTPETFRTAEGAEKHIDKYLAKYSRVSKLTVVPVRVTVSRTLRRATGRA